MPFGAIIGGALGLIGASKDRKEQRRNREQDIELQDPVYRRERLEKAGLNPSVHFGATGQTPAPYQPVMGRALSDAGALLANGFDNAQQIKLENTRLELEKRKLDEALKQQVIRPTVGGVYHQRRQNAQEGVPSNGGSRRLSGDYDPPVREAVHKYIDVWDSDIGDWISILNPELTESGPQEMATGVATLGGAAAVQHGIPAVIAETSKQFPQPKRPPKNATGGARVIAREDKPFKRPKKRFDDDLEQYKLQLQKQEMQRVTRIRNPYFGSTTVH